MSVRKIAILANKFKIKYASGDEYDGGFIVNEGQLNDLGTLIKSIKSDSSLEELRNICFELTDYCKSIKHYYKREISPEDLEKFSNLSSAADQMYEVCVGLNLPLDLSNLESDLTYDSGLPDYLNELKSFRGKLLNLKSATSTKVSNYAEDGEEINILSLENPKSFDKEDYHSIFNELVAKIATKGNSLLHKVKMAAKSLEDYIGNYKMQKNIFDNPENIDPDTLAG